MNQEDSQVRDLNDENKIRELKKKERRQDRQDLEDLKFILSSVNGRRFVWKWLGKAGVFKQSAHNSGSWTYFNEGQRSIGLELLEEVMMANPDALTKMMKEFKQGD